MMAIHLKSNLRDLGLILGCIAFALLVNACASIDPGKIDVAFEKSRPVPKITTYTQALADLGLMSEIYETPILRVQSIPIFDNTGSALSTGGEIPKDISEMVKSSLNSIGGNLIYVPYDPSYIQNQMVTGYSNFQNKLIPDVVVSGGITEFDRGLETRERNTDAGSRLTYEGLDDYIVEDEIPWPSKEFNFRYGTAGKAGLARITLDFNLLNFQSMSGIPRINAVNTIEVQKAMDGKELGISIFGQSFGRKGKIKKVQGRHAAIRLLVELSMVQIVGRQLILPYWNLLGEDALPDKVVLESATAFYESLGDYQQIAFTQQQLFLCGYDVRIDGVMDENTIVALSHFQQEEPSNVSLDTEKFLVLWSSIPINKKTLERRYLLSQTLQRMQEQAQQALEQSQNQTPEPTPAAKPKAKKVVRKSDAAPEEKMDDLLKMLENRKRSEQRQSSIPKQEIQQLLEQIEKRK